MSYIIQRKVRKAIYVYECTSYRNKAGKPRNHQRYLGRLDKDGVLITKRRKLPAKIKEVKTITRRFILDDIPINQSGDFRRDLGSTSGLSSRHEMLKPASSEIFCAPKKSRTTRPILRKLFTCDLLRPEKSRLYIMAAS